MAHRTRRRPAGIRSAVRGAMGRGVATAWDRPRAHEPCGWPRLTDVQTVLAFDFGLKRIGIASGDTLTATAAPRPAVAVHQNGPDWDAITREVRMLSPRLLVVGAPYNADGSPGTLAPAARRFAAELERRFGLPVNMVDERWSSLEASAT